MKNPLSILVSYPIKSKQSAANVKLIEIKAYLHTMSIFKVYQNERRMAEKKETELHWDSWKIPQLFTTVYINETALQLLHTNFVQHITTSTKRWTFNNREKLHQETPQITFEW